MPVDRASYRGWEGTARPSPGSILAIAGTMIARRMKQKIVRYLSAACVFGSIMFSAGWFVLTTMEGSPFRALLEANPDADHLVIANRFVYDRLLFFALIVTAVVGAPMIAEDRRAHALRLYFSRPITHVEYVLGKFLAVLAFAAVVLVVPTVAMYLVELGMSAEEGLATARLPTLGRSLVGALLGCGVFTILVLGVSSLFEQTNHAAIGYFAVFGLSGMLSGTFTAVFREPAWSALSPWASLERVAAQVLPMPELSMTGMFGRRRPLPLPGDPEWDATPAWISLAAWTGLGLAVLVWRIRKVEVVA